MSVSPLILILLSMGCGIFLGVIGFAVAQGLQKQPVDTRDPIEAEYEL